MSSSLEDRGLSAVASKRSWCVPIPRHASGVQNRSLSRREGRPGSTLADSAASRSRSAEPANRPALISAGGVDRHSPAALARER